MRAVSLGHSSLSGEHYQLCWLVARRVGLPFLSLPLGSPLPFLNKFLMCLLVCARVGLLCCCVVLFWWFFILNNRTGLVARRVGLRAAFFGAFFVWETLSTVFVGLVARRVGLVSFVSLHLVHSFRLECIPNCVGLLPRRVGPLSSVSNYAGILNHRAS
jgi:hypothetical protein